MKLFACCKSKAVVVDEKKNEVMVAVPIQDYHQILHRLQDKGGIFDDPLFPPSKDNLKKGVPKDEEDEFHKFEWMRIPDIPAFSEQAAAGSLKIF